MKILILLVYYDRPNLVRNALDSIRALKVDANCDFHVAAIDDGSVVPLEPIVKTHYPDIYNKFKFYRCDDTIAQKIAQGGSRMGEFMNSAIDFSDADGVCILCDDDALQSNMVIDACAWLVNNPDKACGYWHVVDYDPTKTPPSEELLREGQRNHLLPINGCCNIDSSQGFWRREAVRSKGLRWPSPQTSSLDICWYQQLYNAFGPMTFMGFFGEYKARFSGTLGNRNEAGVSYDPAKTEGL